MKTDTPARPSGRRPPSAPAPMFGLFLILWVAFAAALIFNQGSLDTVWQWLLELPLLLQIVAWVVFLPLTLALWIWGSDWTLWLRLTAIILIGLANLAVFSPKPKSRERGIPPHSATPLGAS